jgi:hypothetical protein
VLDNTTLDKQPSLLSSFLGQEENEALWIWLQVLML